MYLTPWAAALRDFILLPNERHGLAQRLEPADELVNASQPKPSATSSQSQYTNIAKYIIQLHRIKVAMQREASSSSPCPADAECAADVDAKAEASILSVLSRLQSAWQQPGRRRYTALCLATGRLHLALTSRMAPGCFYRRISFYGRISTPQGQILADETGMGKTYCAMGVIEMARLLTLRQAYGDSNSKLHNGRGASSPCPSRV
ncbi:hypothetical protein GGI43DRAFT_405359 [Trichoderma evansii]